MQGPLGRIGYKKTISRICTEVLYELTNPVPYEAWRKKKTKDRWGAGGKEEEGEGERTFSPPSFLWVGVGGACLDASQRKKESVPATAQLGIHREGVGVRRPPSLPREGGRGDFDYK